MLFHEEGITGGRTLDVALVLAQGSETIGLYRKNSHYSL